MREGYTTQAGSERPPVEGATSTGPVPAGEQVFVTVILRPDPSLPAPPPGTIIGRTELSRVRRASDADLAAVSSFASGNGLTVVKSDPVRRRIVLCGPASAMGPAFDVDLQRFSHPGGSYRGHLGPVGVPVHLAEPVVAVLGLDDRPQAGNHLRRHPEPAAAVAFNPPAVAAAYGYPAALDGRGHTIGFVELGGGYTPADLQTYFSGLGLANPPIVAVSVDGATNAPGGPGSPDDEVMLDIEVAGSIANGASLAVYFAPNTNQGFVDAVSAAAHDQANAPAVLSISWGGPEDTYAATDRQAFEDALTDAALAGMTVTVAAGDNGSNDGTKAPITDYPASSPQVLACGGTSLEATGATITVEKVWNDGATGGATGGGVSAVFAVPGWQAGVGVPASAAAGGGAGRGVPDVAGDADPRTGYNIRVDGSDTVVGGTSAVAPLWGALVALAAQKAGKPLGFINPTLYSKFGKPPALSEGFNDITVGDNGAYQAAAGWDACTGLGSPKGAAIVSALA
jgi:kumamolisin